MADKSNAAVFAGMGGAAAITVTKVIAAALGGSAAMLGSAIHSGIDAVDALLLYLGKRRSTRPRDAQHPFGHGQELYFWTLIVALLMFTIGGLVTIGEGILHIVRGQNVSNLTLNFIVFGLAACFNTYSFITALRQFLRESRGHGLRMRLRKSKDPTVLTVLFEDLAALLGLLAAFLGVLLAYLLDAPALDGVGSIIVGLFMATVAGGLIYQSKTLLSGETANDEILESVRRVLHQAKEVEEVVALRTMHLAPTDVLVNLKVRFRDDLSVRDLAASVERLEDELRHRHPELRQIFIEPGRPRDAA